MIIKPPRTINGQVEIKDNTAVPAFVTIYIDFFDRGLEEAWDHLLLCCDYVEIVANNMSDK